MDVRYEIENGTNAVKVFYGDSEVASLYQPNYPNGESWESREAATTWAELYVTSIVDTSAPYAPVGPGEEGRPKPTAEQIAENRAKIKARRAKNKI